MKDELRRCQETKDKWVKRLDQELEQNAVTVETLTKQISELKDANFKLEFQLNQRETTSMNTSAPLLYDMKNGSSFDSASTTHLQFIIKELQKMLKSKEKQVDALEQKIFYYENTLQRDNAQLQIQVRKLKT